MSEKKEAPVQEQEKVLDHVIITAQDLQLLEQKLQILNPHMVKYVIESLDSVIKPIYKGEE